ncbi:hypothetical protein F2P79_009498 [Pimephales promelas]|nr:hypothetical protein F2P79_009498 [Pimephales promelas]
MKNRKTKAFFSKELKSTWFATKPSLSVWLVGCDIHDVLRHCRTWTLNSPGSKARVLHTSFQLPLIARGRCGLFS